MQEECCKDPENWINGKYKDVIYLEDCYYTVYLCVCQECGEVVDKNTWVER